MRNIDPNIWGPSAWNLLHKLADENPKKLKNIVESLICILPCDRCRSNYSKHVAALGPVPLKSSKTVEWVYNLHNRVSNKAVNVPLLESIREKYQKLEVNTIDIAPFLYSIVESHPGGGVNLNKVYTSCMTKFWSAIFENGSSAPVQSRKLMRIYLKKQLNGYMINILPSCNKDICLLP